MVPARRVGQRRGVFREVFRSKERGQARLPDPETPGLSSIGLTLKAYPAEITAQLETARGQEGGLPPLLLGRIRQQLL